MQDQGMQKVKLSSEKDQGFLEFKNITLVGGIFEQETGLKKQSAPEVTLGIELEKNYNLNVNKIGHGSPFLSPKKNHVLHVHHLGFGGFIQTLCSKKFGPVIFTMHDARYFSGQSCSLIRRISSAVQIFCSDCVISLSERELNWLNRSEFSPKHLHRVNNGIDSELFNCKLNSRPLNERNVILYVGQLIDLKRVDLLIRVCAPILKDRNLELWLIYHNDENEIKLRDLGSELGVIESIKFVGSVNPKDLPKYFSEAKTLALLSESEALPSVVSEALMCGVPVFASDVGGIKDQVKTFGFVVGRDDSEVEIRENLVNHIESVDNRKFDPTTISEYAKKEFSIDQMVRDHVRIYESVYSDWVSRSKRFHYKLGLISLELIGCFLQKIKPFATKRGLLK